MRLESGEKLNQKPEGQKEKQEKEPKISYEIFYSSHRTAKDFEKLAEVFPKQGHQNP